MAVHCQLLMKRGKRNLAKHFKEEASRQQSPQQLSEFIEFLLDPKKPLDDFETLDWCRWLIAGGSTYEEFAKEGNYAVMSPDYYLTFNCDQL